MTDTCPRPRFAIIIPARFASTRFPGKPLALLTGATGIAKPLIQRSWECAQAIPGHSGVWVATDDERVAACVRAFGGDVVMTAPECRNGTERCADAAMRLGLDDDLIIVNLQGDAPLTPDFVITRLVEGLAGDERAVIATPAVRCSPSFHEHLMTDQRQGRVGGTTVVFNAAHHARYFSKQVIPYTPDGLPDAHRAVHVHLGVYAYRPDALSLYASMPPSVLEALEGLEQLRFIEQDRPIRIVPFDPIDWDCVELNNPEDRPAIEAVLKARNIE